jgi:hypothetical protein
MDVSAWKTGRSETRTNCGFGINLHHGNRKTCFVGIAEPKVEIEGQEHVYRFDNRPAGQSFEECPELRDEDTTGTPIRDFLKRHGCLTWKTRHPPHFELTSLASGRFRLESPKAKSTQS